MARKNESARFPLGRSGACESRLYEFIGRGEPPPIERVAARTIGEAISYVLKWHTDFDIVRIELVGIIELISGSPLN